MNDTRRLLEKCNVKHIAIFESRNTRNDLSNNFEWKNIFGRQIGAN